MDDFNFENGVLGVILSIHTCIGDVVNVCMYVYYNLC